MNLLLVQRRMFHVAMVTQNTQTKYVRRVEILEKKSSCTSDLTVTYFSRPNNKKMAINSFWPLPKLSGGLQCHFDRAPGCPCVCLSVLCFRAYLLNYCANGTILHMSDPPGWFCLIQYSQFEVQMDCATDGFLPR